MPADWQDHFITTLHGIDQNITKVKLAEMEGLVDDSEEPTDEELEAFKKLDPDILNGLVDVFRMRQQQPRGDFRFIEDLGQMEKLFAKALITSGYTVTSEQEAEVDALIANPASHKARSPITAARLKTFKAYRESHHVAPKTIAQQESKLLNLSKHLKESQKPLDFDAVTAWLDGMDLSSKTKVQYLLAGSMFWKWACKHDAQWRESYKNHVNPFANHDMPQLKGKARKDAARKAFTIEELGTLHAAATKQGLNTLADLILLGSYTGARIEELCQLRTENLIKVEGVRSFDITDSKTAAGIRVVPVHPALSDLVTRLAAESKDEYLVPSKSRNKYGIRSDALSKAFGRLKTSLNFGPQHVFHSIRGSAITHLHRADVPDRLIQELVGHETGTVTFDVYSQGASAKQKLAAISKLPSLEKPRASTPDAPQ
jgi:integrase